MEIKRDVYLNRLINRKYNGFVKVITGIGRCGKSYLLNTLFYNHLISEGINKDHIILFAFDSADDLINIGEDPILLDNSKEGRKVDPKKFVEYISKQIVDEKMYYLLLDEVQKLGAFESVLNGFLRKKNIDIYVIGSKKYYIQSAYAIPDEEKYKQETKSFDKANDSFKKIILVEKSMKPRRDDNGYVCMGVKEFLLDARSLEV